MVWELVFMMVILKIPVVYLAAVVYWAIKAEPRPPEGAALLARVEEPLVSGPCPWQRRRERRLPPRGPRSAQRRRAAVFV